MATFNVSNLLSTYNILSKFRLKHCKRKLRTIKSLEVESGPSQWRQLGLKYHLKLCARQRRIVPISKPQSASYRIYWNYLSVIH